MKRTLALLVAVPALLAGCTCAVGNIHQGGDGGTGGSGGAGGSGGSGGGFSGTLVIAPQDAVLDVDAGQPAALQYSATSSGQPVSPFWTATPALLGTIDGAGRFTATGAAGGVVQVGAQLGGAAAATTLTVRLHLGQNGGTNAADAGAGGVGGVGGEGVGGAVPPATVAVLNGVPTADPGQALLYPYDATVWPRDLLAPLLQWRNGAHDPDAVHIHLECPALVYDGTFARTATPFRRHPIPQAAWEAMGQACAGEEVTLRLVFASGGQAYGPLTERWRVAPANLKGIVYYNSYGTKLAYNYSGAIGGNGLFGGATLAVKGSSTDPVLVAGKTGGLSDCRVCHVVSADGSALLTQHGDDYLATSQYALKSANAETAMTPTDGRFAWGAISPDGKLIFTNGAPMLGASTAVSALYQVPSGAPVVTSGLPAGLVAGTPVFAPDGRAVAFNWYAGSAAGGSGDRRSLAMMRFSPPGTFSDFTVLYTPPAGQTALYPSFLPTGAGVVFEVETVSNGRGFGETRSICDTGGGCSDTGARGELWYVDVTTRQARRLDRLNGLGSIPTGPSGHDDDASLNYEATVAPIASGGFAWVIFTSRRLYGNVATLNPWWSDPRFHDLSQEPTTKKLWVAPIDLDPAAGADPSHPAIYLPAQELLAGNSRGYWALEPCRADGADCESGDQCCGGYCRGATEETQACSSSGGGCSREYEVCTKDADCCAQPGGLSCVNNRCTLGLK